MIQFVPYNKKHELACIELLKSNLGDYFANEEVADFIMFLQNNTIEHNYFVGLKDNEVVACGGWEERSDGCYLRWGMVSAKAHKNGIGSLLLEFRLGKIAELHGKVDVLIKTSGQAHSFYERFGFNTISAKKDGIARGIDQYIMKRTLKN